MRRLVAVTGGIGSGKSTAAHLFADRGAVVISSDAVARAVLVAGSPALAEVVAAFGATVVRRDGGLDRAALAAVVFADPQARLRLESITHPQIAARTAELTAQAPADAIVVHDIPLLVEADAVARYDVVVVVEATEEARLARLAQRGMSVPQAHARMAAQVSDEARRAVADHVLDNNGTLEELKLQVDSVWRVISDRE